MGSKENRTDNQLKNQHPDWNWEYWDAQLMCKCIICGISSPFCTSTPDGSVCHTCVAHLVHDVIVMRKPWDKTQWIVG